jgi:hypothetical protein
MARAYNVHVVLDPEEVGEYALKAAFTVKHELQTWLAGDPARAKLNVVTVRDGRP